jgi:hypothetical protein
VRRILMRSRILRNYGSSQKMFKLLKYPHGTLTLLRRILKPSGILRNYVLSSRTTAVQREPIQENMRAPIEMRKIIMRASVEMNMPQNDEVMRLKLQTCGS